MKGILIYRDDGSSYVRAPCFACDKPFNFNPDLVPSHRATPDGPREPVCGECIALANSKRVTAGLPVIEVREGAYVIDIPCR